MSISSKEFQAQIKLRTEPGLGPQRLKILYDEIGTAQQVLAQPEARLLRLDGIGPEVVACVRRSSRRKMNRAELRTERLASGAEFRLIGYPDPSFWIWLRRMSYPPLALWAKGVQMDPNVPTVAIVGTRRASAYGRRTAHKLAFELASKGVCIVSGLAYGIDAAAHEGALDAGGQTIAVLGSGVNEVYPRAHRGLASSITKSGCLISELEPGARPEPGNFPIRNRIISGLCSTTIVVEAFERAGALITARKALDQNRDLFIVPGRIDEATSRGTNGVLAEGNGQLLVSSEQVVESLEKSGVLATGDFLEGTLQGGSLANSDEANSKKGRSARPPALPKPALEEAILNLLKNTELHIDDIEALLGYPGGDLWVALLNLECDGLIVSLTGNRYEGARRSRS